MTDYPSLQTSHGPTHGGGAILDAATIQSLQDLGGEDDPELLLELIDLFVDDAEVRVAGILEALEQGDVDVVGKMAHALKSASANLGALGFSDACRELEHQVREGNAGAVTELARSACDMYAEVRGALTQLREEAS